MTQITDRPTPPASPYGYQPYPAVQQRTNGLAIASLVLGIVWLWWVGSLLAIIFGCVSLHQIEKSGGTLGGRGMAIAGVVLGWVGFATFAIMVIVMMVGAASSSTGY
jgi:hypothetical protein